MIVVTGAAGFIGSCLIGKLNQAGIKNIIAVDDFSNEVKNKNLVNKFIEQKIERKQFPAFFADNASLIEFVFHLGARTDTAEFNWEILKELNLDYSVTIWNLCTKFNIPLIYASSAATYGLGEHGFADSHSLPEKLQPLNPYGKSKNDFDIYVLKQTQTPPFWAGIKFFNVFGPNEYHKNRMGSVVYHSFRQISQNGTMRLFRSHHPNYKDGEQLRDFIYIKDVTDFLFSMMQLKPQSGIYNLGTGKARTFLDLTNAVFYALGIKPQIEFIDTPEDIREKYQYFTQAEMEKSKAAGLQLPKYSLEAAVEDYVRNYLVKSVYL